MNNNLDKSWSENLMDGSLGRVYLLGAGDFQARALEELDKYLIDVVPHPDIEAALEIIKNLKA